MDNNTLLQAARGYISALEKFTAEFPEFCIPTYCPGTSARQYRRAVDNLRREVIKAQTVEYLGATECHTKTFTVKLEEEKEPIAKEQPAKPTPKKTTPKKVAKKK